LNGRLRGEEALHAAAVESGLHQRLETHPVRLALGLAREVELLLHHGRLAAHDRRLRQVATRRAARARGQDGEQQRADRHRGGLLLARDHARDVALGDVADLVAQYARQLRLALRRDDEAAVHADEAAGQCERVEHRVADDEEHEVERPGRTDRHQAIAQGVQVFGRLQVGEVGRVTADLQHDLLAQAALDRGRQVVASGFAEQWQVRRLGPRQRRVQRE
jgi:hypothetical protein